MNELITKLANEYRLDKESVYQIWFLNNEERLKAFRTIRNGLFEVINAIENRTFGNDFKGSLLETVITAISEQNKYLLEQPMLFIGNLNFVYPTFMKMKVIS